MHFGDLFQMAKMVGGYVMPRKSPFEEIRAKGELMFL